MGASEKEGRKATVNHVVGKGRLHVEEGAASARPYEVRDASGKIQRVNRKYDDDSHERSESQESSTFHHGLVANPFRTCGYLPRNLNALVTTETELRLIANAAIRGDSRSPVKG